MKVERRCILQGISLSDLKVKACLAYSHCLWNARLHFDLSILQIFSWVCTCPHAVCSYLTLFQATNLLSLAYRLSVQDIFFFFYFFFTCRSTCLNRPTAVYWGSCHFLSKQEDVMWGCECCGQVRWALLAEQWRETWLHDNAASWQSWFFFPVPGRKLTA